MKRSDFNRIYKQARTVDIVNNEWFNFAGFFWLNLTELQAETMARLILSQGNKPEHDDRGYYVALKNGMRLYISHHIIETSLTSL